MLLCHALRCERTRLYSHGDDELTQVGWIHYGRYLNERLNGKPTQYITHRQEFYGRDFYVNTDVLIPRPETEHLVEAALALLKVNPATRMLDVGTGSGAVAISLALESGLRIFASDISTAALAVVERNRRTYSAPVVFFAGDLLESVAPRSFDLLVSNPPYVSPADLAGMQSEVRDWEPHLALFADEDGLAVYRRLITAAERVLRPGGQLMLELGHESLSGVQTMLAAQWTETKLIHDLAGIARVITAKLRE